MLTKCSLYIQNYCCCFLPNWPTGPIWSSSRNVWLDYVLCPLSMIFILRPLIGPEVTWSDPASHWITPLPNFFWGWGGKKLFGGGNGGGEGMGGGEKNTKKPIGSGDSGGGKQNRGWGQKNTHKMLSAPIATPAGKKYWCYYPHPSRDSVSPVCGTFRTNNFKTV